MSISPVGNSDAYARYRQQALDLLASTSQTGTQTTPTTAPSYVAPADPTDQSSSNPFATKFKADLSTLNTSHGGTHTHGAHGHHHHGGGADATAAATDPASTTNSTDTSLIADPFGQALDQFAVDVKSASTDV